MVCNESKGLSEEAVNNADLCIQIPMGGIVESLNLGTSTGIILSSIGYHRLKFVFMQRKLNGCYHISMKEGDVESSESAMLDQVIDGLMSVVDDGDQRFDAVYHIWEMVCDGDVSEHSARKALLKYGFTPEEISDVFDDTPWNIASS